MSEKLKKQSDKSKHIPKTTSIPLSLTETVQSIQGFLQTFNTMGDF